MTVDDLATALARVAELEEWNRCEVQFREADIAVWADRLARSDARTEAALADVRRLHAALTGWEERLHAVTSMVSAVQPDMRPEAADVLREIRSEMRAALAIREATPADARPEGSS
jgi:hypothetical protein